MAHAPRPYEHFHSPPSAVLCHDRVHRQSCPRTPSLHEEGAQEGQRQRQRKRQSGRGGQRDRAPHTGQSRSPHQEQKKNKTLSSAHAISFSLLPPPSTQARIARSAPRLTNHHAAVVHPCHSPYCCATCPNIDTKAKGSHSVQGQLFGHKA